MVSVAETLGRFRDEIMNRWAAEAEKAASARGLSKPELRNVLPSYLDALARGASAVDAAREHVEAHLAGRIRQGFDLSEIVEEFVLLERCVNAVWRRQPRGEVPSDEERQAFSETIQSTVVRVTQLFHEHMQLDEQREKRYLRLLQTIADEALRAPDAPLSSRLREVLEVFVEATGAAAASLVLFDPESGRRLGVGAAGWGAADLEHFATSLDPSTLGGKIAASPEPTQVADVEATVLTVTDALRHSGFQSLIGIRLPPRHKLIGILYLGLRETRPFTAREIRTLQALVDRLTLHLDNARLFADLRRGIEERDVERELRERFVAILAHDLRGPLSAAKLSSHLLVSHPERLEQRRDLAIRIERNLDRIDRMIRDLLDVSRLRAGERLPLRLDDCDLGLVAEEVIDELSLTDGRRFELVMAETVRGVWSHEELRRAIWNLAVNAVKYGAPDTPITVTVERVPHGARVSVHNLGKPIAPEDQARLFDLYARIKGSARPGSGWGLGLALVRACAEAHGGTVEVHSSQASGTTFTLELPSDSRPYQSPLTRTSSRARS